MQQLNNLLTPIGVKELKLMTKRYEQWNTRLRFLFMEVRQRLNQQNGKRKAREYLARRGFRHDEIISILYYVKELDRQTKDHNVMKFDP